MRRRHVLGGFLAWASLGSGCLSSSDEAQSEPATVENPPEWLRERGQCEDEWAWGSLELSRAEPGSGFGTAVVPYDRLGEESKRLVRFAVHNDGAVACDQTGGTAFQTLLGDVDELAERDREAHSENPWVYKIRTARATYRIERLEAFDAVLV
ncbi:hypothetical protein [Natronosalvus caseinilyticus]|uniref:hypothetical protein n=1 Tax=Natronosalvus caseinilyticus TaxID=2953747 RepID=UPI0028A7AC9C|nr:hypothetical protein [Natronosalvus caseinilyticus]